MLRDFWPFQGALLIYSSISIACKRAPGMLEQRGCFFMTGYIGCLRARISSSLPGRRSVRYGFCGPRRCAQAEEFLRAHRCSEKSREVTLRHHVLNADGQVALSLRTTMLSKRKTLIRKVGSTVLFAITPVEGRLNSWCRKPKSFRPLSLLLILRCSDNGALNKAARVLDPGGFAAAGDLACVLRKL